MRRGTSSKLSQNRSTIASIMRMSVVFVGRFSSRAHGRLRAELGARLGQAAHRHLERRIVAQRIAVVGIRVAGGDQQSPVADHLGKAVPHPLGRPWIGDAAGQPLGDPELALDLGQHQHAGIRGQPTAIEGNVNRLAGDG